VLLQGELLAREFLHRHEDLYLGQRERQEAEILQLPTPSREWVGGGLSDAQIMDTAAVGVAQKEDREEGVDQDDNVLDILVQSRRNKHAAKKFFRKLLKGLQYVPRVVITDKLKSYGAAKREILPGVEHRQSRYLNNRCENSHRPTRQREYHMQGFKSPGHAQRFLSAYGPIAQHFRPRRHLLSASAYRQEMRQRFASWAEITGTERVA